MSCFSNYSCPITIPQGLTGAGGAAGIAGAAGVAIYANTIVTSHTSSGLTNQTLETYTFPKDLCAAGDILTIEGIFQISSTFTGTVYLSFGGTNIVTYTRDTVDTSVVPDGMSYTTVRLKATIYFKTTATQSYVKEIEIFGNDAGRTILGLYTLTVDTTAASTILAGTYPTASTSTSVLLTVSLSKKV